MLEDILLITDGHRKAADQIEKIIIENRKKKMIVAISGESGSGKSELTHEVAKRMRKHGIFAKTIHTDNFYNTLPLQRRKIREEGGIEKMVGIQEYKWDDIHRVMDAFKKGETSQMPCVDLITEQVDQLTTDFSAIDMLVVDGLYAINADGIDFRFFIDLTYLQTKKKHTKDVRGKEIMDEGRWATLKQEHKMVRSLLPKADYIITEDFDVVENPHKA